MRAAWIALVIALALLGAEPDQVAACMCEARAGDVIFTGTVTSAVPRNGPHRGSMIYSFNVESVERGSAGDGRVYSRTGAGHGAFCGRDFVIGAKYRVHADVVDPAQEYMQETPTVPLVTGHCLEGEQLGWPSPVIPGSPLFPITLGGLALAGAVSVYLFRRRD